MTSERRGLLLRWLVTAGVIFLAFELARAGIADFLRLEPCAYLDSLNVSGKRPDPARLEAARDRLALAGKFDPDSPIVHEYLGIAYFHRAMIGANDPTLRIAYLETARDHYKRALALRQNSGFLWAGMAAVSSALLESRRAQAPSLAADVQDAIANDAQELKQALAYASRLAPWEPAVLSIVTETGKRHYAVLDPAGRELVDAAARRAEHIKTQ